MNDKLSYLDWYASILMKDEARKNNVIPTAWLVTSDEVITEYRLLARQTFIDNKLCSVNDDDSVINKLLESVSSFVYDYKQWLASEKRLEEERAKGNPRAFFVE